MMSRTAKPVPAALTDQAESLRARRMLAELDSLRFVRSALHEGVSQADIAGALGVSQATVSRMAARAAVDPAVARPGVDEIIDRATAGEIDRTEMLRRLRALKIGYARGRSAQQISWISVRQAVRARRLSLQEADVLATDIAERTARRVVSSMELEAQPVPEAGVITMIEKVRSRLAADLD